MRSGGAGGRRPVGRRRLLGPVLGGFQQRQGGKREQQRNHGEGRRVGGERREVEAHAAGSRPRSSDSRRATATTTTNPDNETSGITTSKLRRALEQDLDEGYNP
jgi:hypothetical protein